MEPQTLLDFLSLSALRPRHQIVPCPMAVSSPSSPLESCLSLKPCNWMPLHPLQRRHRSFLRRRSLWLHQSLAQSPQGSFSSASSAPIRWREFIVDSPQV